MHIYSFSSYLFLLNYLINKMKTKESTKELVGEFATKYDLIVLSRLKRNFHLTSIFKNMSKFLYILSFLIYFKVTCQQNRTNRINEGASTSR